MITKYKIRLFFLLFLLSLFASCSDEGTLISNQSMETKTIRLCFNAAPPTFDSLSTRAVLEWPDSAKLYIKFHGSSGYSYGKSTYSSSDGEWNLSYKGSIDTDAEQSCEVWYFENAGYIKEDSVEITPYTCIYYDSTATYLYKNGVVYLEAHLHPGSARFQFMGMPGTTFSLNNWQSSAVFNPLDCTLGAIMQSISLTTNRDGYTPYFYGYIENSAAIDFIVGLEKNDLYVRHFKSGMIQNGKSYYLRIPIDEFANQEQWTHIRSFTVNGNGKSVTFNMIKVNGGFFEMGASDISFASPVHIVALTKDYYMGETEVTQALWYAIMRQAPTSDGNQWITSLGIGDEIPAYYISYEDCQRFLSGLNSKLSSQLISNEQFRFPTEAEWEFAAKGGNKSNGWTYSGSNTLDNVAWYFDNSSSTTHQVKTKAANELGIYDMSGNVWEWCYDWYGSDWYGSYSTSSQIDPIGPIMGSFRVRRGGSRIDNEESCRVANRNWNAPSDRRTSIGFRLCLGSKIEEY